MTFSVFMVKLIFVDYSSMFVFLLQWQIAWCSLYSVSASIATTGPLSFARAETNEGTSDLRRREPQICFCTNQPGRQAFLVRFSQGFFELRRQTFYKVRAGQPSPETPCLLFTTYAATSTQVSAIDLSPNKPIS